MQQPGPAVRVRIPPRAPVRPVRCTKSSHLLVTATVLRHSPAATAGYALRRQPRVDRGWTPMATVFPATLTFNAGVGDPSQVRAVTITGERVRDRLRSAFRWQVHLERLAARGWLLNPPPPPRPAGSGTRAGPAMPKPGIVVPVTFTPLPTTTAPAQATMTVNIQRKRPHQECGPRLSDEHCDRGKRRRRRAGHAQDRAGLGEPVGT
jgi:hypothetical protein